MPRKCQLKCCWNGTWFRFPCIRVASDPCPSPAFLFRRQLTTGRRRSFAFFHYTRSRSRWIYFWEYVAFWFLVPNVSSCLWPHYQSRRWGQSGPTLIETLRCQASPWVQKHLEFGLQLCCTRQFLFSSQAGSLVHQHLQLVLSKSTWSDQVRRLRLWFQKELFSCP